MSKLLLSLFFALCVQSVFSQQKFTISGKVVSEKDNETLLGVEIFVEGKNVGVTSNEYGFYSLTLPAGEYTLGVNYMGFTPIKKSITLNANLTENFRLEEESRQLQEVVVSADQRAERLNIKNPQMGVNSMSSETIKRIPPLLGQPDVIRSLLFFPGVTNGGEMSSGFNVRGGAADQNLILFDEANVFTTSHLYGLISVFNPEAIKDVTLYKSFTPARYGGRASSVLDIIQKNGNSKNFKAYGGIGTLMANAVIEVPVVKDKSSILLAGRRSYLDFFLPSETISPYFYDLNLKFNYQFNKRNTLYVSGYFGRDVYDMNKVFYNTYGNSLLNVRYNHLYSDKLFANLSLIYSDYYYGLKVFPAQFAWDSSIVNYNLKYDLKHYVSTDIKLEYGLNNIYYVFNPGNITPISTESKFNKRTLTQKYANEFSAYIGAEQKLTDRINLNYGLRLSYFVRLKQAEINTYKDDDPILYDEMTSTYRSANPDGKKNPSGSLADYLNYEPRIAVAYTLNETSSIKLSYNRMAQYIQVVTNSNSPTPLDIWTPSGKYVKPMLSDQYSFGYFKEFGSGMYSLEVETYYKAIQNKVDYIDGAQLIGNEAVETLVLNGRSRAYGLELMFKKNKGRFTGWASYTLSRSEQQTPGRTAAEIGINNGQWYKTPYDRTHNLSVTGAFKIDDRWSLNANFVYQTGRAFTQANGWYAFRDENYYTYGERNGGRLPDYHRLDISASYSPKKNNNRKFKREWVFGIYNVYSRKNTAFMSFQKSTSSGKNEMLSTSIFPILPFVSCNIRF